MLCFGLFQRARPPASGVVARNKFNIDGKKESKYEANCRLIYLSVVIIVAIFSVMLHAELWHEARQKKVVTSQNIVVLSHILRYRGKIRARTTPNKSGFNSKYV
jgi:hypothetical protein